MSRPRNTAQSGRTDDQERSGEKGAAVLELPLVLGLILLPFGIFLLSVSTWVERQAAARSAASEVARALVFDGDADVVLLVAGIEAGHGLEPGALGVEFVDEAVPGGRVTVVATVVIPRAVVPVFGSIAGTSWSVEHVERRPDYGVVP